MATQYIEDNIKTVEAAIPFYLSTDNSLIEKFMLTSDWLVDYEIKYTAFYLFIEPKRFNWKTKVVLEIFEEKY